MFVLNSLLTKLSSRIGSSEEENFNTELLNNMLPKDLSDSIVKPLSFIFLKMSR